MIGTRNPFLEGIKARRARVALDVNPYRGVMREDNDGAYDTAEQESAWAEGWKHENDRQSSRRPRKNP
jgi:hypothetical protein